MFFIIEEPKEKVWYFSKRTVFDFITFSQKEQFYDLILF